MLNFKILTMKNTLRFTVILAMASFFGLQTFGQKNRDALFLKNGSQIYGKMEQVSGGQFSVRTGDGSLFVFDSTDVDHFVISDRKTLERKESGFGFGAELGFLAGPQNSEYPAPFSFAASAGYTFSTRFMAEIGSGLEFLGNSYAPLFAGFRFSFTAKRISPYVFARSGYLFMVSQNEESYYVYPPWTSYMPVSYWYTGERDSHGGPTLTAGMGTSIAMGEMETIISFAYRHFTTSETVYTSAQTTEEYTSYHNRLEIKVGFRF